MLKFFITVVLLWNLIQHTKAVEYRNYKDLGVFDSFLYNYFRIVANSYSSKKIVKYCKQVAWVLTDQSGYREMDKLAKAVKDLCDDRDSLKDELRSYQKEVLKKLPARVEFFKAINEAFTPLQAVQFNDYNAFLEENSAYPHPDASKKTKWLVKDVIIGNIKTYLTSREKYNLKKKLKRAVKEYERSSFASDPDFNYLVQYFKTKKYP